MNNFQLTTTKDWLGEREFIVLHMSVNGLNANSLMPVEAFNKGSDCKGTLFGAISSLIEHCYQQEQIKEIKDLK